MSAGLEPPYGERDASSHAAMIDGAAGQIERALAESEANPWRLPIASPRLIVAGGMGGSAIAADFTAAIHSDRLTRPLLVVRDYRWPAWVTSRDLVVVASYSGGTEESLALYEGAARAATPRVALTTGGRLAQACERDRVFWRRLPEGFSPRAAVFSSWVAWSGILAALGEADEPRALWSEAMEAAITARGRWGSATPEERNPAKQLARRLAGRHLVVYGGSERLEPLASRWRTQINENAKLPGHSAVLPELNHNEIVGWERPGDLASRTTVVFLNDRDDPPEDAVRAGLTAEYVVAQGARAEVIEEPSGSRLSRWVSWVLLGDYVSLYLALLSGVDPTPIASIDAFKRRLAARGSSNVR